MNPDAVYWDQGVRNVPDMTGARHLLDGRDLDAVCLALDIETPLEGVLDVGCGTGRLARLVTVYQGVDITQAAVDYCTERGLTASVVDGPDDLPTGPYPWVTCISVFTHISRSERQAYLYRFAQLAANVLVDIIPGDGGGDVAYWTAAPDAFEADARRAGFSIVASYEHAWDNHTHRYYRLRRVGG